MKTLHEIASQLIRQMPLQSVRKGQDEKLVRLVVDAFEEVIQIEFALRLSLQKAAAAIPAKPKHKR